jgi:phage host-nuclease inhibitor protein Gam
VEHLQTLLAQVNIEPERLEMFNLSAAMGKRWAEICNEFTAKIKKLGPSPMHLTGRLQQAGRAESNTENKPEGQEKP